jgi:hypothetical protein
MREIRPLGGWSAAAVLIVAGVAIGVASCNPPAGSPGEELFVDVAAARGIDVTNLYGESFPGSDILVSINQVNLGNGAGVGDYDGDGDLDVYLCGQLDKRNRLFRNNWNAGEKTFTEVTDAAGVNDGGLSRLAHFVDLDNDGHLDLLLINDDNGDVNNGTSKIFRNKGDGTFADVTGGSHFRPVGLLRCGAAVADYDQDGLLDIYVTNWGMEVGSGNPGLPGSNRLYRNLGQFVFEDVSEVVGLDGLSRDSFTAIFQDFNDDLYPDLFVALDHTSDEFYANRRGIFENVTEKVRAIHTGNDMGVACADFDDDDDLDLYVTNITEPEGRLGLTKYNALQMNRFVESGKVSFRDEAEARGVGDTYWGWGTEFTDVDNDGDLDIVAVSGMDAFVFFAASPFSPIYQTPSVLFINDGTGHFSRRTGTGLDLPRDSRCLIAFDYDRDGDEDLLVTNIDQPVQLFENDTNGANHWLDVELRQRAGLNRFGIGATVYATVGGKTMRRDLIAGESYLAGTPAEAHFGLGDADTVDELRVRWTDGSETVLTDVPADQFMRITQPESEQ